MSDIFTKNQMTDLLLSRYTISNNVSDHNCPKGFHIFDTETRELERIPNDLAIFKKIIYDDRTTTTLILI